MTHTCASKYEDTSAEYLVVHVSLHTHGAEDDLPIHQLQANHRTINSSSRGSSIILVIRW